MISLKNGDWWYSLPIAPIYTKGNTVDDEIRRPHVGWKTLLGENHQPRLSAE
jgi:hypothetical protein